MPDDVGIPSCVWSCVRREPRRLQVSPRLGGKEETISRRILEASLHPFPDVETPICSGPSR